MVSPFRRTRSFQPALPGVEPSVRTIWHRPTRRRPPPPRGPRREIGEDLLCHSAEDSTGPDGRRLTWRRLHAGGANGKHHSPVDGALVFSHSSSRSSRSSTRAVGDEVVAVPGLTRRHHVMARQQIGRPHRSIRALVPGRSTPANTIRLPAGTCRAASARNAAKRSAGALPSLHRCGAQLAEGVGPGASRDAERHRLEHEARRQIHAIAAATTRPAGAAGRGRHRGTIRAAVLRRRRSTTIRNPTATAPTTASTTPERSPADDRRADLPYPVRNANAEERAVDAQRSSSCPRPSRSIRPDPAPRLR